MSGYQNSGNWTGLQVDALLNRAAAAPQFHGFEGRTGSSLSMTGTVLTLAVPSAQSVWLGGVEYALTANLTLDLGETPDVGTHYIVAQDDGAGALELVELPSAWSITETSYTPVAAVYWNGSAGAVQEERHGHDRNLAQHAFLHKTRGAAIENDGSFAQTRPTTTNDGQLELVAGSLWDADIENAISTAQGKLCRLWYETASGVWTWADGTANSGYDRPYIWNSGTSLLRYPNTGSAYALTDCANNRFIAVWVYASNDVDRPIYVVTPSLATTYSNVANARAATAPVLPFAPEVKLLYRFIYRGDGEYQEAADYRTASSLPSGGVVAPVASSVVFTPYDDITATQVQAAIQQAADQRLKVTGGTLDAGTITNPAPILNMSQTWNDAADTFTAIKANVTDTASASGSLLLDLQVGGSSNFSVKKGGTTYIGGVATSTYGFVPANGIRNSPIFESNYLRLDPSMSVQWVNSANGGGSGVDVNLIRDSSAGVLCQVAGTNAQEFRLYGSYTSATAYQRLSTKTIREAVTTASGASVTTTISIPKYTHLIGVTTRVTTALGTSNGTTGYTVGDGTDADLWGAITGTAQGTTSDRRDFTAVDALGPDGADRTITLTATGGNFDGTGVIEVCAYYLAAEAD